jgi:hypothetical protein
MKTKVWIMPPTGCVDTDQHKKLTNYYGIITVLGALTVHHKIKKPCKKKK